MGIAGTASKGPADGDGAIGGCLIIHLNHQLAVVALGDIARLILEKNKNLLLDLNQLLKKTKVGNQYSEKVEQLKLKKLKNVHLKRLKKLK